MYLPGVEYILLFFAFVIAIIISAASGSPLPPVALLSLLGTYLTYSRRIPLIELIYGERALLLEPVERVEVKKDYIILYKKNKVVISVFLKVKDVELIESDSKLGELSSAFVSALHAPTMITNVVATPRGGYYEYYLKLNFFARTASSEALKSFSQLVAEVQRRLLAQGVSTTPASPQEVFRELVDAEGAAYRTTLPRALTALLVVAVASIALAPGLVPLAAVLLPLVLPELKVARGGRVTLRPKGFSLLSCRMNDIPDNVRAGSLVRSMRGALTWGDEALVALLVPEDPALLAARASKAMEVLEAGRAGASRLRDEFKAVDILNLYRALESGSMPFRLTLCVRGNWWRLEPLGFERASLLHLLLRRQPYYELLNLLLGLPGRKSQLKVSSQLAWLTPHAFVRPRTKRTSRAIYLGHGLRRDEEVWLELDLLENVHGLIIGPMGSGKSTTARTIALRGLESGLIPIIIDPSGEYRKFAEAFNIEIVDLVDKPFNIFDSRAEDLARAFSYVSPLSEYELYLLRRLLEDGVRSWPEALEKLEGTSLGWKLERLKPYFYAENQVSVAAHLSHNKPLLLCMGSTSSGKYVPMPLEVQRFAVEVLLSQLRDYALSQGLSEPKWLLIMDEGHLFIVPPPGFLEPSIATVARTLRKFGLAVVLLTHEWGDVPESMRRTVGWKLALSHSDPDYVEMTRVYMAFTPSEVAWFQRGVRGRAILRRGHEPYNILVEIEPIEEARTDWAYGK